jgi:hypothetical protein
MPSWPLHVRNRSSAPLRFHCRIVDDRHDNLEHHLSIPTQSGLPVRFRSRSALSAKKSLANQKNTCFDRSKTSQLRCIAMFKAFFRTVRRAKSSKRKHWEKLRNRKIASTSILTPNASRPSDARSTPLLLAVNRPSSGQAHGPSPLWRTVVD